MAGSSFGESGVFVRQRIQPKFVGSVHQKMKLVWKLLENTALCSQVPSRIWIEHVVPFVVVMFVRVFGF